MATGDNDNPGNVDPQTPNADPQTPSDKTFTQEEVNRMMGRTRRETEEKFSDYEALKANSDQYEQLRQSQLTAEDKAKEELAKSQKENAQLQGLMVTTAIAADIQTRAASMGVDPDVAVAMVDRGGIKYDAETQRVTGTEEALKGLVEAKPFLSTSAQTPTGPPNINAGDKTPATPSTEQPTQDEIDAAAATGISIDKYMEAKTRAPDWAKSRSR